MSEEIKKIVDSMNDLMNKAIIHLESELQKIRAGKANPQMLDSIHVDYYGTMTQLGQVANVNTPDARTIVIQPWEKSMIGPIEKAILAANLGLTPQNDGLVVRLNIPPLSEERRKDLVKKAKAEGEVARVSIRNIRRDSNELIKAAQKKGLPEDEAKAAEEKTQQLTNGFILKVDKHLDTKEKEIMTV